MKIEKVRKESFTVIGKEGSTLQGEGFIQKLYDEANAHFNEIAMLARKDEQGNLLGIWGLMSDFSRSYKPWENFNRGLYLAGVEVFDDSVAPAGWNKWTVPAYEYLKVEAEGPDTFDRMVEYLKDHKIELAGAVFDYSCLKTGRNYMYFPVEKT
ncbi:MAG: GyrI-like domain-containing protein [Erysipelotrichaceae bacterium]|nr:GyrI-like domain-containing protein [Erysipelotrichaceae bacterium]